MTQRRFDLLLALLVLICVCLGMRVGYDIRARQCSQEEPTIVVWTATGGWSER